MRSESVGLAPTVTCSEKNPRENATPGRPLRETEIHPTSSCFQIYSSSASIPTHLELCKSFQLPRVPSYLTLRDEFGPFLVLCFIEGRPTQFSERREGWDVGPRVNYSGGSTTFPYVLNITEASEI